ncbi:MAG: hypothetical protein Ct9H300mP16_02100 [Pseudomonadota bacterium]|nr:MAG: hypothetical protein Ct9H300mP16_02100 [Pseudomonadota bacterium]
MTELHPSQHPATMQGLLEIVHRLASMCVKSQDWMRQPFSLRR